MLTMSISTAIAQEKTPKKEGNAGNNKVSLRILVPFQEVGEKTFFLEVRTLAPFTTVQIQTKSKLENSWVAFSTEQPLITGSDGFTQLQAPKLLSDSQFFRAMIVDASAQTVATQSKPAGNTE